MDGAGGCVAHFSWTPGRAKTTAWVVNGVRSIYESGTASGHMLGERGGQVYPGEPDPWREVLGYGGLRSLDTDGGRIPIGPAVRRLAGWDGTG